MHEEITQLRTLLREETAKNVRLSNHLKMIVEASDLLIEGDAINGDGKSILLLRDYAETALADN